MELGSENAVSAGPACRLPPGLLILGRCLATAALEPWLSITKTAAPTTRSAEALDHVVHVADPAHIHKWVDRMTNLLAATDDISDLATALQMHAFARLWV